MNSVMLRWFWLIIVSALLGSVSEASNSQQSARILEVAEMNGLVAFWDFHHGRDGGWESYFDNSVLDHSLPIYLRRIGDDSVYSVDDWPYSDEESKLTFDDSGPFGTAIKFNKGHIYGAVSRNDFDGSALDVHGKKPFTLIAWVKFVGERHLVAGIWDEGGWNRYDGMRQYALFAGLFRQKGVIAHISATGAASFPQSDIDGSQYARLRAIDGQAFEDEEWIAMGMTHDPEAGRVVAYLNGKMTPLQLNDPVTQDVFELPDVQAANPFAFEHPIFSPQSFLIKFNGHAYRGQPIKEHRLWVDLNKQILHYETEGDSGNDSKPYRVRFEIRRDGQSLLAQPLYVKESEAQVIEFADSMAVSHGDVVWARLETQEKGEWSPVGTAVQRVIRQGAPFTIGRALGLGSEEIEHGSQLFVDGVAVFNRVLSKEELTQLSFR
jgi:hypothetical protein